MVVHVESADQRVKDCSLPAATFTLHLSVLWYPLQLCSAWICIPNDVRNENTEYGWVCVFLSLRLEVGV